MLITKIAEEPVSPPSTTQASEKTNRSSATAEADMSSTGHQGGRAG